MATFISPSSASGDNYVLLTVGMLRLLLPQQDVGEAEYLEGDLCASEQPGRLQLCDSDSTREFVALSEHMEPLPQCPSERFLVTRIGADELGWCWDDVQIMHAPQFKLEPLPPVLLTQDTPFTHYIEVDSKLAFLCTAQQLCAAILGET